MPSPLRIDSNALIEAIKVLFEIAVTKWESVERKMQNASILVFPMKFNTLEKQWREREGEKETENDNAI